MPDKENRNEQMLGGVFQLGCFLLSVTANLGAVNHIDHYTVGMYRVVKANGWPTCN